MTSGNLCLQLWTIETSAAPCPTDLGGTYTFSYDIECNPAVSGYADASALCSDYIAENSGSVTLSAELEWADTVCDPIVFEIEFEGFMSFYTDDTFGTRLEDTATGQYALGDTAYVEV